ncbi:IS66 family transposase [Ferruginibacter sp.]|uniref:IS66 family transposase n=1 Tax=Ferruginibacter sp. TaxID=1940288 RepID=UPI0026593E35|nr:IS66 family transposase [Ferruginibacter sp.]
MQHTITDTDYKSLYENACLRIAVLEQELAQIKKIIFGSKQERFAPTDSTAATQLSLNVEAEAIAAVKITNAKKIEYTKVTTAITPAKLHPGRNPLPEHLERREQIILPVEDISLLKKIGEEVTEELEYEPGKLFVNKIVRPKYAKTGGEGILIAPMIERPLPKAIAGPGLLAQITIDKYVDHLPLHRQMERFKRDGVNMAYSTLTDMVSGTCSLITPLYEALKNYTLRLDYLHADETPIKVLDKDKKGQTHRGYFWVYHSSVEKLVFFDYQPGRGREGPQQVLKEFKGYLQTDGYSVYDFFKEKEDITVLHCMAHARRMFYEAQANDAQRSAYALEQFASLYAIERTIKEQQLTHEQSLQLRQQQAVPILQSFGQWMKEEYVQTLPKSTIGKALGYSIERWKELSIYATDAKFNIDNNPVENSIRPVAIGRKNYLFAGSHEAAQRSAMLYSLLGTCKLNGINPFIWLRETLRRIATHPINKIEELLPQNFKLNTTCKIKYTC